MSDPFTILVSALLPFWWLPVVLLAMSLARTPMAKGWIGEILLHLYLRLLLDRKRYHLSFEGCERFPACTYRVEPSAASH